MCACLCGNQLAKPRLGVALAAGGDHFRVGVDPRQRSRHFRPGREAIDTELPVTARTYAGGCHCGRVPCEVTTDPGKVIVCN
jgi:hypothetical protein